jgi:hypothetical protein
MHTPSRHLREVDIWHDELSVNCKSTNYTNRICIGYHSRLSYYNSINKNFTRTL